MTWVSGDLPSPMVASPSKIPYRGWRARDHYKDWLRLTVQGLCQEKRGSQGRRGDSCTVEQVENTSPEWPSGDHTGTLSQTIFPWYTPSATLNCSGEEYIQPAQHLCSAHSVVPDRVSTGSTWTASSPCNLGLNVNGGKYTPVLSHVITMWPSCDCHVMTHCDLHLLLLLKQPTLLLRKFTNSGTKRLESLTYCSHVNNPLTETRASSLTSSTMPHNTSPCNKSLTHFTWD